MKIKLIDFNGPAPVRAHDNDAGADVFSPRDQTIYPAKYISCLSASVWNCLTAMWGTYFLVAA